MAHYECGYSVTIEASERARQYWQPCPCNPLATFSRSSEGMEETYALVDFHLATIDSATAYIATWTTVDIKVLDNVDRTAWHWENAVAKLVAICSKVAIGAYTQMTEFLIVHTHIE